MARYKTWRVKCKEMEKQLTAMQDTLQTALLANQRLEVQHRDTVLNVAQLVEQNGQLMDVCMEARKDIFARKERYNDLCVKFTERVLLQE